MVHNNNSSKPKNEKKETNDDEMPMNHCSGINGRQLIRRHVVNETAPTFCLKEINHGGASDKKWKPTNLGFMSSDRRWQKFQSAEKNLSNSCCLFHGCRHVTWWKSFICKSGCLTVETCRSRKLMLFYQIQRMLLQLLLTDKTCQVVTQKF